MTQAQALDILKTGANVFLTGEPGSGKTHTIDAYVAYLRSKGIEPAVTASTGIAATHIGGITIHSWSGIGIKQTLSNYDIDRIASTEYVVKRVRRSRVLIIDEVSMLHPNTLAMVDAVCRAIHGAREPFGGMQVVCVGDFFQLPPVVRRDAEREQMVIQLEEESTFSYQSSVWERLNFLVCYLSEQHRQEDADFLSLLSAMRRGEFSEREHTLLETRRSVSSALPKETTKLFSHNEDVDRVNLQYLKQLGGQAQVFEMATMGHENLVAVLKKGCLSPERLELKEGAVVMFTKNSAKEGFFNGTLGVVTGFERIGGNPIVKTRSGKSISVKSLEWAVEENGVVRARITQIPLRLAWAITVHKSQGMSLDSAVIDLGSVFEYGQGYVALSRVRRLDGLYLIGWNPKASEVHPEVLQADGGFRLASSEAVRVFSALPKSELAKMHKNFITAVAGKKKPATKK